jgi:hypothetical protein
LNQLDKVFNGFGLEIPSKETERIFAWFDRDGDGIVNSEEIIDEIKVLLYKNLLICLGKTYRLQKKYRRTSFLQARQE